MNRLSVLKIMTLVLFLIVGGVARGEAAAPSAPPIPSCWYSGTCTDKKDRDSACRAAMKEMNDAKKKAIADCRASGIGKSVADCSTKLSDCAEESDIEQPSINFSFMDMGSMSIPSKCSEFSYTDYRSEAKSAKQSVSDAQKTMKDHQKDQSTNEKDYSKKKAELQRSFKEADEKKAEDDLKDQENERNAESQQLDTSEKLKEAMMETQSKILDLQSSKIEAMDTRSLEVSTFNSRVKGKQIECRMKTEDQAKKFKSRSKSADLNLMYQSCMDAFFKEREQGMKKLERALTKIDSEMTKLSNSMTSLQKKEQTLATQAAQAKVDRANKKQQADNAFQRGQAQKYQELVEMDQQMTQDRVQIAEHISQAKAALFQASNELTDIENQKPKSHGGKSTSDAHKAMADWGSQTCSASCKETSLSDACSKMEKTVPSAAKSFGSDSAK